MEVYCCSRAKKNLLRFLALVMVLRGADAQYPCYYDRDRTLPVRCMPSFGNAAYLKTVISNNTCGTPPSEFCVQNGYNPTTECTLCDASDPRYRHPAVFITDAKSDQNRTWWQSETLLDNPDKPVTLTLDLGKSYEVWYIRIRFQSPRPESMAIYKRTSTDPNAPWIPYQYMSNSCEKTYKVPTKGTVTRENQQVAVCSKEFSSISPLTGGNVAFTTLQGRPDRMNFENSPALQEWVTASAIRIDLDRMNTFGDEIFGDANVLLSYYFAIINLAVGGRCKCNGHAASCRRKQHNDRLELRCVCEHNTAGVDCQECRPLYNDRPWARATEDSANECRKCDCNNLADSCVYDAQLGYGRCLDCKRNSAGPKCERCRDNFFRQSSSEDCQPCNCNEVGSVSLQCDTTGQCRCKPGVTGVKCDRCGDNFFYQSSSDDCQPCNCNEVGSVSLRCDTTGQCRCKPGVTGVKCGKCRDNFFRQSSSDDCQPCNCNEVGSVSLRCDSTGQCRCKPGVTGVKCDRCRDNYFRPSSSDDCQPCNCNKVGSVSLQCDTAGKSSVSSKVLPAERVCQPRRTIVPVEKAGFQPCLIELYRCLGTCKSLPNHLQCVAASVKEITVYLQEPTTGKISLVTMPNHTECRCDCEVKCKKGEYPDQEKCICVPLQHITEKRKGKDKKETTVDVLPYQIGMAVVGFFALCVLLFDMSLCGKDMGVLYNVKEKLNASNQINSVENKEVATLKNGQFHARNSSSEDV